MFNFFRKSKKESGSSKDLRDKKGGCEKDFAKENSASPTQTHKDMCKNNLPATQTCEIAPQGVTSPNESRPRENSDGAPTRSENDGDPVFTIETNLTKPDLKQSNSLEEMEVKQVSYASIVKKDQKPTHMVKPCGHGTVGVSPRMPPSFMRRDSLGTPPESPKFEAKNAYRKNATAPIPEIPKSDENSGGETKSLNATVTEEVKNDKTNDTVTASMKLRLNLPVVPSPSAVAITNSIVDKPPLDRSNLEESEKKNLINQEAKFQSQLNDLSKQLSLRDAEVSKLRFQMEELQRDVFAKSAGMDRLQAELQAAQKESDALKQKLKVLDEELADFRKRNCDLADEVNKKTENFSLCEQEAKSKISELDGVIGDLQTKIGSLETQINDLNKEKEKVESDHQKAVAERDQEKKQIEETLEKATMEKAQIDKKWEQEFEKLRTINILKEQQLLDDFEWKLREVEKRCKKRLEEKDKNLDERLKEACKDAELKMKAAQEMMTEVEHLKSCKSEVDQLRGLTQEQEKSLKTMMEQQDQMLQAEKSLKEESKRLRTLIDMEKENLQHMQMVHHQEILEKERTLQARLDQKKTEIAMYWEERLLHECSRLKTELEQLHNEEKNFAIGTIRREKDEELSEERKSWDKKLQESFKEVAKLKSTLKNKEEAHHNEVLKMQTNTDRDIMELRRLMNKIDMMHHDKFEKLVQDHDQEMERINEETEKKIKDIENHWQNQVTSLRATLELVKEQMERESQQKIQELIEQHRSELDEQWDNLIHQKSEAVKLVEEEYVTKYKTLEEQFYTQQKSHEAREVELLKTIDSLKNEIVSKDSTMDDLQNNVDTMEGGIQVLNQEIAQQGEQLLKVRRESDYKIRTLQEAMGKLQEQNQKTKEEYEAKVNQIQKQTQETIHHLTRKCECLTKLFEEVRSRYERRESRQEDLNLIGDLRQVIAEQEKDLACINEEKRYFQMRLMNLERRLEEDDDYFVDSEDFEEAPQQSRTKASGPEQPAFEIVPANVPNGFQPMGPPSTPMNANSMPTIPECDDCDEC